MGPTVGYARSLRRQAPTCSYPVVVRQYEDIDSVLHTERRPCGQPALLRFPGTGYHLCGAHVEWLDERSEGQAVLPPATLCLTAEDLAAFARDAYHIGKGRPDVDLERWIGGRIAALSRKDQP